MTKYYHVIAEECFRQMFMHNVKLSEGYFFTKEAMVEEPLKGAILSPYTFYRANTEKEKIWEKVRSEEFPELPSRVNDPMYLFEGDESLELAKQNWWNGRRVTVLEVNIIDNIKLHKADSKWLDCAVSDYEGNARLYWSGIETDAPLFEVIFQGVAFFPDWEDFKLMGLN